ncbi:LysR family transcriptional regulator [Sphingomonas sp. ZB1N12]|uniref:LysR family transcriptional regulator n=1 Tax=Sphingomonas arabinosi TaxID=3096160 RepID=UPI002FC65F2B
MADKFEDLRTYIAIVESGGVNAAAAKLEIAKSATSRRLSDLEERLGVTLILRTTRSFELTEAGRTFYGESRRILDDMASVEERLRIGGTGAAGHLVVAADRGLSRLLMPSIASFHEAHPDTRITLRSDVANAGSDTLVVTTGHVDPERASRRIGEFRSGVFASPTYLARSGQLRTPADLAAHDGILVAASDHSSWIFGSGNTIRPRPVLTVADNEAALAAANANLGLAQLPAFLADAAVRAGDLVACLADHDATTVINAAKPSVSSAEVDGLLDHLIAALTRM